MAELDDEFAFVATAVEQTCERQRQTVVDLLGAQAATAGLASHLELLYAATASHIAAQRAQFSAALDDVVRRLLIDEMRSLMLRIRNDFQRNIAWATAARSPGLDLGTKYYVEQLARHFVGASVELTVVPGTGEMSYATASNPWRFLIDDWGGGIPSGSAVVVVVLLPAMEHQTGLLHPLIVHELGHAADSAHGYVRGVINAMTQGEQAAFDVAANDLVTAGGAGDKNEAIAKLIGRLQSWVAEAFCDAVAALTLGPTYLYSFVTEVVSFDLTTSSDRHPPPRQRVRLLLDLLDGQGWGPTMASLDAGVDSFFRGLAAVPVDAHGADQYLVQTVDTLAARIWAQAQAAVGHRRFDVDDQELAEVVELLAAEIPPAQRLDGTPVRVESIMLAGWKSALERKGGGPAALGTAPSSRELAQFMPAALELAAIADAWTHS